MTAKPAFFLLDENDEAYCVLHFCDEFCRSLYRTREKIALGTSVDWIDGSVCDSCGEILSE